MQIADAWLHTIEVALPRGGWRLLRGLDRGLLLFGSQAALLLRLFSSSQCGRMLWCRTFDTHVHHAPRLRDTEMTGMRSYLAIWLFGYLAGSTNADHGPGACAVTREQAAAFRGNMVILVALIPGYALAMLYIEAVFLLAAAARFALGVPRRILRLAVSDSAPPTKQAAAPAASKKMR